MDNLQLLYEDWRYVPRYEGIYLISNRGVLISLRFNKRMRSFIDEKGYYKIKLQKRGHMLNTGLHRIIAIAFIPNPNNLPQVNHLDGNPSFNVWFNFEWCTAQGNMDHKMKYLYDKEDFAIKMRNPERCAKIGKSVTRAKNPFAKKVVDTVTGETFGCVGDAADRYGYTYNQLKQWLNGRRKNLSTLKYAA